jgi:hypothetical protein
VAALGLASGPSRAEKGRLAGNEKLLWVWCSDSVGWRGAGRAEMERLHGSDGTAQSLPLTKSGGVGLAELFTNRVDRSGWYDISQSIVICSCEVRASCLRSIGAAGLTESSISPSLRVGRVVQCQIMTVMHHLSVSPYITIHHVPSLSFCSRFAPSLPCSLRLVTGLSPSFSLPSFLPSPSQSQS